MTSVQITKKIDKLVHQMVKAPVDMEKRRKAVMAVYGLWSKKPRTAKDLKRVRNIIWGKQ